MTEDAGLRRSLLLRKAAIVAAVMAALAVVGFVAFGRIAADRRAAEVADAIADGRLDEAADAVDRWLDRRPRDPQAHAWSSRLAIARERDDEAAASVRRAAELGIDLAEVRDIEGALLAHSGHFEEAERMLRDFLNNAPGREPLAASALARIGMATFRFGAARDALARWRRDAPRAAEPWLLEGEVAERLGDDEVEAALDAYRQALRRDPGIDPARLALADLLRRNGRYAEATPAFDAYLDHHPDDAEALAGAGLNALKLGRSEEAERFLGRAVNADPSNFAALKGLAQIAEQDGRLDRALEALEAAAEVEPDDPEIAYRRSLLLARLGRPDEAAQFREESERLRAEIEEINTLRDALVRAPNDVDLEYRAARWLIEHDHAEEGVRWAEKALEDAPGHPPTCRLLVEHYEAKGVVDLANFYRWQLDEGDAGRP